MELNAQTIINIFPDENLAEVIREILGKDSLSSIITQQELESITYLNASNKNIESIEGMGHLINLKTLYLYNNQINDFTPLNNLINLEVLYLYNNQISDITALSNLTNLKILYLHSNKIENITPLSNLTNLKFLYLQNNRISDITAMVNLINLKALYLYNNKISDVSSLASLTNLKVLYLYNNQISNITSFSNLINLKTLYLHTNLIENVTPLSNLSNLEFLYLQNNQISNIAALSNLTNLKNLYLSGNQINDITALSNLSNLTSLYLQDNQISNVTALSNLTNLEILYLYSNQIIKISALNNLTNLKFLYLQNNRISKVNALSNLTNLKVLYLDRNQINDVYALSNLTNLTDLYLYSNNIGDIGPLANLTGLTFLQLDECQISDIDALGNLINLSALSLQHNQITDITALGNLTNLKSLYLTNNSVSNISVISNLTSLTNLHLHHNQISDITAISNLPLLISMALNNQRIERNETVTKGNLEVDNFIINYDGNLIVPSMISNDGTYENGKISWDNLTKNINATEFDFNQSVQIGSAYATFSGIVIYDLIHLVSIKEIEIIEDREVSYGTKAEDLDLPTSIEVTLHTNDKIYVPISWRGYNPVQVGVQKLEGVLDWTNFDYVDNTGYERIEAVVTVKMATIINVEDIENKEVDYGSDHGLPLRVEVILNDNSKINVPISWSGYNATTVGTQTVEGALNWTNFDYVNDTGYETVTTVVTVKMATIISVENIENKEVYYCYEHGLPSTIEFTLNNNSKINVPISWSGYSSTTVGAQEITGILNWINFDYVDNSGYDVITAVVTVNKLEIDKILTVIAEKQTVECGYEHTLPTNVNVLLTDGSTQNVEIHWTGAFYEFIPDEYRLKAQFKESESIKAGIDLKIVYVTVNDPTFENELPLLHIFPDEEIRAIIAGLLGVNISAYVTQAQLANITTLEITLNGNERENRKKLRGIPFLTGLTTLIITVGASVVTLAISLVAAGTATLTAAIAGAGAAGGALIATLGGVVAAASGLAAAFFPAIQFIAGGLAALGGVTATFAGLSSLFNKLLKHSKWRKKKTENPDDYPDEPDDPDDDNDDDDDDDDEDEYELDLDNLNISDLGFFLQGVNLDDVTAITARNQRIPKNEKAKDGKLEVSNFIKDYNGKSIDPSSISNNGSYSVGKINWNNLAVSTKEVSFNWSETLTVEDITNVPFSGKVEYGLNHEVTVKKLEIIPNKEVEYGSAHGLPSKIEAELNNDDTISVSVSWSSYDSKQVGDQKLTGTLDWTDFSYVNSAGYETTEVTVTVKKAEIKEIDKIKKTVSYGTKKEDLELPEKVTVILKKDNEEIKVPVEWNLDNYDSTPKNVDEPQKIEGNLNWSEYNYVNSAGHEKITGEITLEKAEIKEIIEIEKTVKYGTEKEKLELPEKVTVVLMHKVKDEESQEEKHAEIEVFVKKEDPEQGQEPKPAWDKENKYVQYPEKVDEPQILKAELDWTEEFDYVDSSKHQNATAKITVEKAQIKEIKKLSGKEVENGTSKKDLELPEKATVVLMHKVKYKDEESEEEKEKYAEIEVPISEWSEYIPTQVGKQKLTGTLDWTDFEYVDSENEEYHTVKIKITVLPLEIEGRSIYFNYDTFSSDQTEVLYRIKKGNSYDSVRHILKFDSNGRAIFAENEIGETVRQVFDDSTTKKMNKVKKVTYNDELSYEYTLNDNADIIEILDPNNGKTKFDVSDNHEITKSVAPKGKGNISKFEYNDNNPFELSSCEIELPGGKVKTEFNYDRYGNVTKNNMHSLDESSSYGNIISEVEYTNSGNYAKEVIDSRGFETQFDYDETTGNLDEIILPNNTEISYEYDNVGRVLVEKIEDLENNYVYNDGLLSAIKSPNSVEYHFDRDIFGNVTQVKVGDLSKLVNPSVETLVTNHYGEGNGLLNKVEYGNNQNVSFEYDRFRRLIKKRYNSTSAYTYEYNDDNQLASAYDPVNELTTEFEYDDLKRLTKITRSDKTLNEVVYDKHNLVKKSSLEVFDRIQVVQNNLDASDMLEETQFEGEFDSEQRYRYDGLGRLSSTELSCLSDGIKHEVTYASAGSGKTTDLINSLEIKKTSNNGKTWENIGKKFSYIYDEMENITEIRDFSGNLIVEYTYDKYSQLVKEINNNLGKTISYEYNSGGNITKKDGKTYAYDSNWKDKLISYDGQTITYDEIGNPLSYRNGLLRFEWTQGKRVAKIIKSSGDIIEYKYDSFGIRTQKKVVGKITDFLPAGTKVIAQKTGDETILWQIDGNGQYTGFIRYKGDDIDYENHEGHYFYLKNAQGDITGITDCSGEIVCEYVYDTWGKLISIKDGSGADVTNNTSHIGYINPIRYRGYYYDSDIGLYYLNARYYDPEVGRFINADSTLASGLNLYEYCHNNPVRFGDWNGCGPGDAYPTQDAAAIGFANYIYSYGAGYTGYEYAANIIPHPTIDDQFTFTIPQTDRDPCTCTTPQTPGRVADIHSHGTYIFLPKITPDFLIDSVAAVISLIPFIPTGNEYFSDTDLQNIRGRTQYVATPSGKVLRYNPGNAAGHGLFGNRQFNLFGTEFGKGVKVGTSYGDILGTIGKGLLTGGAFWVFGAPLSVVAGATIASMSMIRWFN